MARTNALSNLSTKSSLSSSSFGQTIINNRDVVGDGTVDGNNNGNNDLVFVINDDNEIGHNNIDTTTTTTTTTNIISNQNMDDMDETVLYDWNNLNRSNDNNNIDLASLPFEQKKNSHQMQIYNNQQNDRTKKASSTDPILQKQGMNHNRYQKPWYQCKNVTIEIPLDYNHTMKNIQMTSIQMNVSSGLYPIIQWDDDNTKSILVSMKRQENTSSSSPPSQRRKRRHIIYGTMSGSCISLLGKTGYMRGNIQFQYTIPPSYHDNDNDHYNHRVSFVSGIRNVGIQNNDNHESINKQHQHQQQTLYIMIPKSLLLWIINQHNNNNIYFTTTITTSKKINTTTSTNNNKYYKILPNNKPTVICISSCTIQNLNKGIIISTKIFHIKQYIISYYNNKRKELTFLSSYPNISIFMNCQLFSNDNNSGNNKNRSTTTPLYYHDSNKLWMILNPYYHFIISFDSPQPSIVTNLRTGIIEDLTKSNNTQSLDDSDLQENNDSKVLSSEITSKKERMMLIIRDLMNHLSRIWKWNIQIDWTNNKMNNNANNTSILSNLFIPSCKLHMSTINPPLFTKKRSNNNNNNNSNNNNNNSNQLLPIPIIPSTLKYDITWTWYGFNNGWNCSMFWTRHIYYINQNTISLMNRSLTSISDIDNNNDETNHNSKSNGDQLKPPPLRPNRIFGMGIIWNATVENNSSTNNMTSVTDVLNTLSSNSSLWSGMILCNYILHKLTWIISWTQSDLTLRIPIRLINIIQPSNHIIHAAICTVSLNIISRFIQESVHQIFVSSLQQSSSTDSNQNSNAPINTKRGMSSDHDMNMMYNHMKQLHQVALKQQSFMMKQAMNRMKKEKDMNGLIIKKATYSIVDGDTFDVTIPLQFWTIENSQLILYKPFYHMIGFYNIIPSRKWNKYQKVKQRRQEQEQLQQQQQKKQQRSLMKSSLLWNRTKSYLYYFLTGRDYNDDYNMEYDNDYDDDMNKEKVCPKLSIWYEYNCNSYYYEVYDKPDDEVSSSSSNIDDDMVNKDSNRIIIPNPNASPSCMSMLFM